MGLFNKIFGNKEEADYRAILSQVSEPLVKKIDRIPENEIRKFFWMVLDTSEKVLRSLLFKTKIISYKKELTSKKFDYWIKKVSLVMISYSYYCVVLVKNWYGLEEIYLKGIPYNNWFDKVFSYYNKVFNENISKEVIDYYASGYKEDAEEGYSKAKDEAKVQEGCERDYRTIGADLLQNIWGENIKGNENKGIIIGTRIWEAHRQLIKPYLEKLANKK